MKKFFILSILICSFFSTALMAQTQISGKIIDKSNGETLPDAVVQVEGTTTAALTDIEGKFNLSVAPGTYTLVISFISYETSKVKVEAKANQVNYVEFAMSESKSLLQEVVITATQERSAANFVLIERKKAVSVSDGISSAEIRKTPDRTTSDVLKRVTGASIQEGKFAIIRGMNDRYNAGYLDGALLPSTESDRKAFAFDVVPANLIDNLTIIKAGSADLVGDFGGGIIKINTKAIPDKFTQSLTIGAQYHSTTTSKDFLQFERYAGENFNILSSQRDIPNFTEGGLKLATSFPNANDKTRLAGISQIFNNDWSNQYVNAAPNARFAYSIGLPIRLRDNKKIGVIAALTYANTRRISDGNINTFDGSGQVAGFIDRSFLQNTSTGGIFNVNYVSSKTQINFRNLLNSNTDNNTISRTGAGNISDGLLVQNKANLINFNRLYNGIVSLKQTIGEKFMTLNASVSYSNIFRTVPDYRIVSYTSVDNNPFGLSTGDFFNSSTGRFASTLNENLYSGNLELNKQFDAANIKTDVKVGYFYQNRDRDFSGRSFVYGGTTAETTLNPADDLGQKNIGASKLYLVEKTSDDIAYYRGSSLMNAGFISVDQKYKEKLRMVYGVRYEDNTINVDNQKTNQGIANIQKGSFLPSVNACYYLNEKTNIRADYFASVNRPEFRELAPFSFFVFDKNAELRGNKNLQVATLQNFDVRYEFFPDGGQLFSVGGFYKSIQNPVELSLDITQPFTTFTFQNEKSAKIYGLEFEVKKKLGFIGKAQFFQDLGLYANLSLIKSQLTLNNQQAKQDRPLQGQSPYLINAGLQYNNANNGWSASLAVNRTGRRIAYVGVDPKYGATRQDIYEAPRTVIDFQLGKTIKNLNIKLTMGDLLHSDLTFYQDANQDGKYTKSTEVSGDRLMFLYNNGFSSTLSFGYTF